MNCKEYFADSTEFNNEHDDDDVADEHRNYALVRKINKCVVNCSSLRSIGPRVEWVA